MTNYCSDSLTSGETMLKWINDRLPTEQDANTGNAVLVCSKRNRQVYSLKWDLVAIGEWWAHYEAPQDPPTEVDLSANYTTAEAAKLLKCAPQKIRDLIHQGELQAVNTSMGDTRPRWLITSKAIDVFQERRAAKQETSQP